MAKTLQFRRDTTANLASVTGAEGEIFIDLTKDTVVVMDGSTSGGFPLATESYVGTAISNLIDSAPGTLDTLNELAAALGDDANFATSISNTVATAGSYANSAYAQANTASVNATSAGSYANSAYAQANTGTVLAQAAFNAANTGGGGGSTGDFTFTANTITLPVNTDGVLNVTSDVATSTNFSWSYSNSTVLWTNNQNNTTSRASMYINADDSMNNFKLSIGNNLNPVSDDPAAIALSQLPVGTVLTLSTTSGGTYSRVCTLTTQFTFNGTFWEASVSDISGSTNSFSVTSLSYPVESAVQTDYTYTFSQTGEFISDSALIGDILISNDIITPVSLDSYGEAQSGTLTVNGDLDILGAINVNGAPLTFEVTPADVGITKIVNGTSAGAESIGLGKDVFELSDSSQIFSTVAFGEHALRKFNGSATIGIGYRAARYIEYGGESVFIGANALHEIYSGGLGSYNVAVGAYSGPSIGGSGIEATTCIGASARTSGDLSTAIGASTQAYATRSTAVGYGAGSITRLGENSTAIGNIAQPSTNDVTNEFTLGNSSITTLRCQVTSITSLSDARDKKDITSLNAGLDFVSKLKPVAFTWNMRDGGKVDIEDTGFIAQDLQQTQQDTGITIPGLVYESNPDKLEASYGKLIPVLVKAIQDLQLEVESLKSQLNN
jgi:hypothetical protein